MRNVTVLLLATVLLLGCLQEKLIAELNSSNETTEKVPAPMQNTSIREANDSRAAPQEKAQEALQQAKPQLYPAFEDLKRRLRETGINCDSSIHEYVTDETLAIDPLNPNTMYVAVAGKGFYKSVDSGATWVKKVNGIFAYPSEANPSEKCYWIIGKTVIDPSNSNRLLIVPSDTTAGTIYQPYSETAGIWETADSGENWRQLLTGDMNAGGRGSIAFDSNDPLVIYFGVDSDRASFREAGPNMTFNKVGVLYKTTDGGKTWRELPTGIHEGLQVTAVFVNPGNSNELLVLTQNHEHIYTETSTIEVPAEQRFGPMKSTDGGETWAALKTGLPIDRVILDGDVAKHDFNHIIVRPFKFASQQGEFIDQKSFYSKNGGETFSETSVYIDVGRFDPFDETGNHLLGAAPFMESGKIMQSTDGGATWTAIADFPQVSIPGSRFTVSNFVWHPVNRNTVFLTGNYGQVWKSTDNGKTWNNLLNLNKLQ